MRSRGRRPREGKTRIEGEYINLRKERGRERRKKRKERRTARHSR